MYFGKIVFREYMRKIMDMQMKIGEKAIDDIQFKRHSKDEIQATDSGMQP
jgi:hypothetical protein